MNAELVARVARVSRLPHKNHFTFIDDLLGDVSCSYGNNVEKRATHATRATLTTAQHWLDTILDDKPVIEPVATAESPAGACKVWRISVPGRAPFGLICVQGATHAEVIERYRAGTTAEPLEPDQSAAGIRASTDRQNTAERTAS